MSGAAAGSVVPPRGDGGAYKRSEHGRDGQGRCGRLAGWLAIGDGTGLEAVAE